MTDNGNGGPGPIPAQKAALQAMVVAGALAVILAAGSGFDIPWTGPVGVVAACAVVWWFLASGGEGWCAIGLARPRNPLRVLVWSLAGVVAIGLMAAVMTPVIVRLVGQPQNLEAFAEVRGNLAALAGVLAISWSTAAFGEEILFRGFLLHRLSAAFGGGRAARIAAVALQAALFGLAHFYQGPSGMILVFLVGLVMGTLFIASGRNLWVVILAHGLFDSLGLIAIFFGFDPSGGSAG
jgi:membrane protease YdiL (CAAX protease family)